MFGITPYYTRAAVFSLCVLISRFFDLFSKSRSRLDCRTERYTVAEHHVERQTGKNDALRLREKFKPFSLGAGAGHHVGDAENEPRDIWWPSCPPLKYVQIPIYDAPQAATPSGELPHRESGFICGGSLLVPYRINNPNAGRMFSSRTCTPCAGPA